MKNLVQLMGHLGSDPEMKNLNGGSTLAKVGIAINNNYKNNVGQWVTDTQWHNLIGWGEVAEKMSGEFKKGSFVSIKGKLDSGSYESKKGDKVYYTQVVVNEIELAKLEKKEVAA